jgi:hypothetical protein
MSGLKIGDRVELISDIGHRFRSRIGIITAADQHTVPVLKEFVVRLADGGEAIFSGFQLKKPPARAARRLVGSDVFSHTSGMRGKVEDRHLLFVDDNFDIHLKVATSQEHKNVLGQVTSRTTVWELALVTLLAQDRPYETATTDSFGDFMFRKVPAGNLNIEILIPSHRIVVPFDA